MTHPEPGPGPRGGPGPHRLQQALRILVAAILLVANVRAHRPGNLDTAMAQVRHLDRALHRGGAERMQRLFPEGYVFTWALFGLAAAQIAMQSPEGAPRRATAERFALEAVERVDSETARATFVADMQLSRGAFYASWSLYLQGAVVRALGPSRFSREWLQAFERRCDEFAAALEASVSPFLRSYPGSAWPADTAVGVAALAIHDQVLPPRFARVVARWVEKARSLLAPDPPALAHAADPASGAPRQGVRGSSLALMSRVLVDADPAFAREQYTVLRQAFMGDVFGLPGVREYPRGSNGPGDIDSGPILLGCSGPSIVVGVGAAKAHGDERAAGRILRLVEVLGLPTEFLGRRSYAAGMFPIGDAFLAWARSTPPPTPAATPVEPWKDILTGRWVALLHLCSAAMLVGLWFPWRRRPIRPSGARR